MLMYTSVIFILDVYCWLKEERIWLKTTDYAINEERPYGILIAGHYTETAGYSIHRPPWIPESTMSSGIYLRESYRERAFKPKKVSSNQRRCPKIILGTPCFFGLEAINMYHRLDAATHRAQTPQSNHPGQRHIRHRPRRQGRTDF
ncbi:hypothetical protein PAPH110629_17965 [Paenibacillus phoenicis]